MVLLLFLNNFASFFLLTMNFFFFFATAETLELDREIKMANLIQLGKIQYINYGHIKMIIAQE